MVVQSLELSVLVCVLSECTSVYLCNVFLNVFFYMCIMVIDDIDYQYVGGSRVA